MRTNFFFGVLLAIILILVYNNVYVVKIASISMHPTFKKNEKVVYLKRKNLTLEKKDVILFNHESSKLIKRLMVLPGDSIFIMNNLFHRQLSDLDKLKANMILVPEKGYALDNNEDIIKYAKIIEIIENKKVSFKGEEIYLGDKIIRSYVFAEDLFFVEGDNKVSSVDSRKFGLISRSSIIGKVLFKLF